MQLPLSRTPPVDVRLVLSGLWTSLLILFVFVDLFSLYRPDVRASIAQERIADFAIDQTFLLAATLYITLPALMVGLSLLLPYRVVRWASLTMCACYAPTIVLAALGEWHYYVMASGIELLLLLVIAIQAWCWQDPVEAATTA